MKIISLKLIHKIYKNKKNINNFPNPHHIKKGFFILELKNKDGVVGYGEMSSYYCDFKEIVNLIKKKFLKDIINNDITNSLSTLDNNIIKHRSKLESTIEAALNQSYLDIIGKQKGMPVFKLLGKTKNKVKAYASGGLIFSNQEYYTLLDEVYLAKEKKFFGWKFRPSTPKLFTDHHKRFSQRPKIDVYKLGKFCSFVRKKIGDSFNLMIDLGCRLKPGKEASYFFDLLNDLNFYFVEEPFNRNYFSYKRYIGINNIACGEDASSIEKLKKFSKFKQIKFLQPDSNLLPFQNVLKFSKNSNSKIIVHNWTKSVSFYSNLNLALINKKCDLIEYNFLNFPKDYEFLKKNYVLKNGYLNLSSKSGMGIKLIDNSSFKTYKYNFGLNQ